MQNNFLQLLNMQINVHIKILMRELLMRDSTFIDAFIFNRNKKSSR